MNDRRTLFTAPVMMDGERVVAPAALLVEGPRIVAAGEPEQVGRSEADWRVQHLTDTVLLPAMVNAHAHLDLSHIGPIPFTGDFQSWVNVVRRQRAVEPGQIAAAVERGVELARAGGTALVGDIAGIRSTAPVDALRRSGVGGVSYLEIFGIGRSQQAAIASMRAVVDGVSSIESGVAAGVQPHAPYSCGLDVYRAAAELGRPLATHLAETKEELQFVSRGDGPLRDMLQAIGVWDETAGGSGVHPIEHLAEALAARPVIAAHLNYVDEAHLDQLANWQVTVAYCPRASDYFGHPHGGAEPHRYREMMKRGINVALGTDSILCLNTADRLSVLDDVRFVVERDAIDPVLAMRMATVNGARALGFDPQLVRLCAGRTAGVIGARFDPSRAADPITQILTNDRAPRWVVGPFPAHNDWLIA